MERITKAYHIAKEQYAEIGIDTDEVIKKLRTIPISVHCWQADDVGGFENPDSGLSGGMQTTGNYPGKASNIDEVRMDMEKVFSLIPGRHRFSLHASYGDFSNNPADRDAISSDHFRSWVDWAKENHLGLDFNSTFFSHPKSDEGYTLAHNDRLIRDFWIEHGKRCREISAFIGKELNKRCTHNIWIPDGAKDITVHRFKHRKMLKESLDLMLSDQYDNSLMRDSVESKLFGIGSESFVVGSHEFYLGYAIENQLMLTLDIGHFHPTESVADKISSVFQFVDEVLLHVTRGIRWDSDHVVILNDQVNELMNAVVWAEKLNKVNIGLDFFDASINRIGAYVIGTRATQKALLLALLSPLKLLQKYEDQGMNFEKLAILEECKCLPFGTVWDYFCAQNEALPDHALIPALQQYEKQITSKRG